MAIVSDAHEGLAKLVGVHGGAAAGEGLYLFLAELDVDP